MRDVLDVFALQRRIIGVCPRCRTMFRLSSVKISTPTKFEKDWMDEHDSERKKHSRDLERWAQKQADVRKREVERTRREEIPRRLREIDRVFIPRNYWPRDVRILVDPVEFVVFDGLDAQGLRGGGVGRVVLLTSRAGDRVVESVAESIAKRRYGWRTVRVSGSGEVTA